MPEAIPVFGDPYALHIVDTESDPNEERFVAIGLGAAAQVRGTTIKCEYDFSNGKRGRIVPPEPEPAGKTHVTVWLDHGVLDRFFEMAERSGGSVS